MLFITAACQAEEPVLPPTGPSASAVCERFVSLEGVDAHHPLGVETSAEVVEQRRVRRDLIAFGRWAQTTDDERLAGLAADLVEEGAPLEAGSEASAVEGSSDSLGESERIARIASDVYAACLARTLYRSSRLPRMSGACSEVEAPALSGERVIVYGPTTDFAESTCVLVQGRRIEAGCTFAGVGTAQAELGDRFVEEEVAFDPDTCQALYEVGRSN
jgi:hypothetical protein